AVPEGRDVQPGSIKAMAQGKAAVRVRFPRGNALPGLGGDGMTAILPHTPACTVRAAARSGGLLAFQERPAVLLDDDVVEFLDRGVLGQLVEGDLTVLQQVDPVAD